VSPLLTGLLLCGLIPLIGCNTPTEQPGVVVESKATVPDASATPAKKLLPCPVKLIHSRMVHNLEEDVYTTVVNISGKDIAAIAFGAAHTDKFGSMWEPYKINLTSEDTIRKARSQSMHWEVLMETPAGISGGKPGISELFVAKVAFADGTVAGVSDFEGCDFKF
jgi:hypothetical protein